MNRALRRIKRLLTRQAKYEAGYVHGWDAAVARGCSHDEQTFARQAAIGAAVERLEEASATKVLTVTVSPAGWSVSWWDRVWHTFDADTLPAAIASALGEDA